MQAEVKLNWNSEHDNQNAMQWKKEAVYVQQFILINHMPEICNHE